MNNSIHTRAWLLAGLTFLLGYQSSVQAQSQRIKFIQSQINIFYVENPYQGNKVWALHPQDIYDSKYDQDVAGNFWQNTNMDKAHSLLKRLFRHPEKGGDARLQRITHRLLQMRAGSVNLWLIDDKQAPLNEHAIEEYGPCLDSNGQVWPCAAQYTNKHGEGFYYVILGAKNMNRQGHYWTQTHFIHSLMHTREHPDMGAHIFYPYTKPYKYSLETGGDYTLESIPDMREVYWESVSNMASYLYDPSLLRRTYNWLTGNGAVLVETDRSQHASSIPSSNWLYTRMNISESAGISVAGTPVKGMSGYKKYFIRDLSPQFIINNEAVMGILLAYHAKYFGVGHTFQAVHQETKKAKAEDGYYIGALIEKLCDKAAEKKEGGLSHLLPIAYADYLTEYRTTSIEKFCAMFDGQLSRKWVDVYWNEVKDQVRTQVYAKPPIMSQKDFAKIAELLEAGESDDTIEKDS